MHAIRTMRPIDAHHTYFTHLLASARFSVLKINAQVTFTINIFVFISLCGLLPLLLSSREAEAGDVEEHFQHKSQHLFDPLPHRCASYDTVTQTRNNRKLSGDCLRLLTLEVGEFLKLAHLSESKRLWQLQQKARDN